MDDAQPKSPSDGGPSGEPNPDPREDAREHPREHPREHAREHPEDRLDLITGALPVVVSYIGTDGLHRFVNRTFERWFALPRAEILGKTIDALGPELADRVRPSLTRTLRGERCQFELRTRLPELGARDLEVTMMPDLAPDGAVQGAVSLVVDITERRRMEGRQEEARLRVEASTRRLAFMAKASRVFADAESELPTLLAAIAREIAVQFGEVGGLILHHRHSGIDGAAGAADHGEDHAADHGGLRTCRTCQTTCQTLEPFGAPELHTLHPEAHEPLRRLFEPPHRDPAITAILTEVVRDGRTISLERAPDPSPDHPSPRASAGPPPPGPSASGAAWLARFPIAHALLVPLRVRDGVIGVLGCGRRGDGPEKAYGDDERALLEQVAERAAISIEKSRLMSELGAMSAETDLLYELAEALNRAESEDEIYTPAVAAMARQLGRLGLERSALLLFDADGRMRFKGPSGLSERYRGAVEAHVRAHPPWRPDVAEPKVLVVPDVRLAPVLAPLGEDFEAEGIRALASIPLVHAGVLLGAFMLHGRQVRVFGPGDLRVAQTIADQVAKAVGHRRADAERERMITELQRTVKSNELFAGILGHDLRNPLGAILMSATVLSRKAPDEVSARTVNRILSAGQRMNRMITQLLDFTRVRASGRLPIEPTLTDVTPIFQQAIDELVRGGEQAMAKPSLERQGDTRGFWDPERLAQLASNLMSNALRHGSAQRPVEVSIRADPGGRVVITVRNGGTIPPDLLPIIFDPFRRGELRERRNGGLGLGLFITREIAVAHGGNLEVRCADDETVFTVDLPRGPEGKTSSRHSDSDPGKPGKGGVLSHA